MNLQEYQAKALLKRYNIMVPRGEVAATASQAGNAAFRLCGSAVVKAQVPGPGRGQAGAVKTFRGDVDAARFAADLLGQRVVTQATGPMGAVVEKVLVEQHIPAQQELLLGIDAGEGGSAVLRARASDGPVHQVTIAAGAELPASQGQDLAARLGLEPALVPAAVELMGNLCRAFREKECSQIHINPLAITNDRRLVALNAYVVIEESALARHPEIWLLGT